MMPLLKLINLLVLFLIFTNCNKRIVQYPSAQKGILNLSNWDFEKEGTVLIEGEWEFIPNELLTHDDYSKRFSPDRSINDSYIFVPSVWNNFILNKNNEKGEITYFGKEGYATYHLRLILPPIKQIGIKIPDQGTTYKIFIGKDLIVEAGKVGKTKIESIPDYNHFTKTYFVNARELDVYVQISNYHYGKGGFWKSLEIGTPDTITKEREINLGLDLFISGALLIMGIYHLSLYSLRTVDKSTLWFGVMCILVFIRTLVTGEYFLYELYPNINFELAVKLEYLSFYLSFPVFTLFIRGIFIEFYQRYFRWSVIFSVLFAIPVVILEANVYTKFINIFQIVFLISLIYILFILIKLSFNKNVDARIFLFGFFILTYTSINDILSANYIINTPFIGPLGLLFFIFSQSYLLSRRFSGSFLRAENLSRELKILSENLEFKVTERTQQLVSQKEITETALLKSRAAYKDLEETQQQLIEAERMASLGHLVAGVAHEINNPIGVIKSNSEMLVKNLPLFFDDVPHYLNSLSSTEKEIFYNLLSLSKNKTKYLSTKEERNKKKLIKNQLVEVLKENIDSIEFITEQILLLNLENDFIKFYNILGEKKFIKSLELLQIHNNQNNYLNNIGFSVEKASRVIFALRTFLSTEMYYEKKNINLKNEIENSLLLYENYILGKVNVIKDYIDDIYYTCINENLSFVWKNLIFNSIQAMYSTEKTLIIKISTIKQIPEEFFKMNSTLIINDRIENENESYILVSFIDSGVGISESNQKNIFSPFYTTKAIGEGIGLGLYVSKKIIHDHKGEIFFKSESGKTEFYVVLPINLD
jgi:signal transduction histidine kinase